MSQTPQSPAGFNTSAIKNFAQFVQLLEDGKLNEDLTAQLLTIAETLSDYGATFGKAKGKLTLSIEFNLDHGVFDIRSKFDTKLPQEARSKSIFWITGDNEFTPENPRQGQLFGKTVRDVAESTTVRAV